MIGWRRVRTVIAKDWLELSRNSQLLVPLMIVPLVFAIVIPAIVLLVGNHALLGTTVNGLQSFLEHFPKGLLPPQLSAEEQAAYAVIVFFMAPFFLLIPVMVASITASSSIVGEKEHRTIEGLFFTPLTNQELVLAKMLGSLFPAVGLSWLAFGSYVLLTNTLGGRVLAGTSFPTANWIVLILVLVPLVAFLATGLVVAVSGRSKTIQGAQGSAMLVVLPVLGLVFGQASGLMLFDTTVALGVAGGLLASDIAVFFLVVARFDRERILTKI